MSEYVISAIGRTPVLSLEKIVEKIGIYMVPYDSGYTCDQVVYNRYVREIPSACYYSGEYDHFPHPNPTSHREVAELFAIESGMVGLMQIQGLLSLFASCKNVYTVGGNEITLNDLSRAALMIPHATSSYPDCAWVSKNLAVFMNTEHIRYFAAADPSDLTSIIRLSDPVLTNEKTMIVVRTKSRTPECLIKDRKITQISELLSSLATSGSPATHTLATIMLFLIAIDHGQTPTKWTQNSSDAGMLLLNPTT